MTDPEPNVRTSYIAAYPEYVTRVLWVVTRFVQAARTRRPRGSPSVWPWKARAHGARPRAGLLCVEADAPNLLEQLNALGYEVRKLPSVEEFVLGVVDISVPGADRVIADMASAGTRVVAFGVDPDDIVQIRTKALGASVVLSRTEFLNDLAGHLPTIV